MTGVHPDLPGIWWSDSFASTVAAEVQPSTVRVVWLPRGGDIEVAVTALAVSLRGSQRHVVRVDSLEDPSALLDAIAQQIDASESPHEPETWLVRNAVHFQWPRVVLLLLSSKTNPSAAAEIIHRASVVAAASRDLAGPLSFVIVGCGVNLAPASGGRCWSPAQVVPEPLPYWRSDRSLVRSGFAIYLSLRVYWEASGVFERATRLAGIHGQAYRWSRSFETDQLIDGYFDQLHDDGVMAPREAASLLARALPADQWRPIYLTGTIPQRRAVELDALMAYALAWTPPGSPRAFVTAEAAHALSRSREFAGAVGMTESGGLAFRRAVRRNEVLAHWVQSLCLNVEREIRNFCRSYSDIDRRIAAVGLSEKLELERTRESRRVAYDPDDSLMEFATFLDLIRIVECTDALASLPTTIDRLHRVRQVRNTVAHLRPVSWEGVEEVLAALEDLTVG